MRIRFSAPLLRLQLFVLLTAAALFSTGCEKDKDFVKIDENIITKYISDNSIANAQRQPSGLYYVPVLENPTGTRATAGRTVSVLYTGMLMNGTVFDASSRNGNTPISFVLGTGRVIKGWDEGIALMREGEKGILLIPSGLGYGNRATGPIPANSVLRFEVELVSVQ
jgi:FKBP-type peptidyl-prolyl cis-trans isomerase